MFEEQLIMLPTNEANLEAFMSEVIEEFKIPDTEDTKDMIATMILHMPQTKVWATKRYFGEAVLKGMANQAAFKKLSEYKANREKKEQEDKAKTEVADAVSSDVKTIQ